MQGGILAVFDKIEEAYSSLQVDTSNNHMNPRNSQANSLPDCGQSHDEND